MKILRNKSKVSTVALVLVLTMAATFIAVSPTVNAAMIYHTSYIFVSTRHDVIGVGQQLLVLHWTADMPRPETDEEVAAGVRGGWYDVSLKITKPDNTTQTLVRPKSDPVGAGYWLYTPDRVGTYRFQVHFPAQWRNTTTTQQYYTSADSDIVQVTVQQEPIESWPETPLPTEYWTRPINAINRDWWPLAANWLAGAAQKVGLTERFAYGQAPESAHIMWSTPMWAGGIMDARFGVVGYQTTHYQGLTFTPPIIINGILFYNARVTAHTTQGFYAVDLYTGETLYYKNGTGLSFGQIHNYDSPNQHGGFPYLWVTSGVTLPEGYITAPGLSTWEMLDGFTGNSITKIANVSAPRGSVNVYGKDGSILYYNIVNYGTTAAPQYYLTVWNSSAILDMTAMSDSQIKTYLETGVPVTNYWQWRPANRPVHDGSTGWSLNVSIPDIRVLHSLLNQTGSISAVREGEYVIVGVTGRNDERGAVPGALWALSLKGGEEGTQLWKTTFTPPSAAGNKSIRLVHVDPEDGVFLFSCSQTRQWYGYSLATGQLLWTGEPEPAFHYFGMNSILYQGMLLCRGDGCASGELIAYNVTTGKVLWKYIPAQVGFESPYGNYPISITCIADGKIYLTSGEHSPTQPLWRGSYLRCVNASNGVELWKVSHWGSFQMAGNEQGMVVLADGFLVGLNFYDNQIYCYGKGPSATTVTAPDTVVPLGDDVLIKGTVIDTAAGTEQLEQAARFPNGVPAISDEDMTEWMEYVYMQQPIPADAKGVEVTLDTVDPNGNWIHIGRVTSDISGSFSYMWTPDIEGKYTVIATFEGSESYYASYAETAIGVGPAPEEPVTPATQPEVQEDIDQAIDGLTPMFLGIIVAIVVVAILVVYDIVSVRKLRK